MKKQSIKKQQKYSAFVCFYNEKKGYMQYSKSLERFHKLILLEGCTTVIIYDLYMNKIYTYKKILHG